MSLVLSSAICRAETRSFTHNFNTMAGNGGIAFNTPTNTIGKTDEVTYTCGNGALFSYDVTQTNNQIAIFLDAAGEEVVTSSIQNLDSVRIYFAPDTKKNITVSIKEGDGEWMSVTIQKGNGVNAVKMPRVGDYQIRIQQSDNVYIKEIQYYYIDLSDCPNCFIYKR